MNGQRVSEFMSREVGERKFRRRGLASIVAYPQNNVRELVKIMKDIKIECLPVFFSPWNKKLVGFIELNKIQVFLND
jgi:predicted transcriptional regulator